MSTTTCDFEALLTFDMVQMCGWNFYGPAYSYILQISKYILIHMHVLVGKKAPFSDTGIWIS